jgi:hypothetical protein
MKTAILISDIIKLEIKIEALEKKMELLEKTLRYTESDQQRDYARRTATQAREQAEALGMPKC